MPKTKTQPTTFDGIKGESTEKEHKDWIEADVKGKPMKKPVKTDTAAKKKAKKTAGK